MEQILRFEYIKDHHGNVVIPAARRRIKMLRFSLDVWIRCFMQEKLCMHVAGGWPDGAKVIGVGLDSVLHHIVMCVEHHTFPEVEPGSEIPEVTILFQTCSCSKPRRAPKT